VALAFWRNGPIGASRFFAGYETPFLDSLKSEYSLDCKKHFRWPLNRGGSGPVDNFTGRILT
jgi:hypothetical protein